MNALLGGLIAVFSFAAFPSWCLHLLFSDVSPFSFFSHMFWCSTELFLQSKAQILLRFSYIKFLGAQRYVLEASYRVYTCTGATCATVLWTKEGLTVSMAQPGDECSQCLHINENNLQGMFCCRTCFWWDFLYVVTSQCVTSASQSLTDIFHVKIWRQDKRGAFQCKMWTSGETFGALERNYGVLMFYFCENASTIPGRPYSLIINGSETLWYSKRVWG